MQKLAVFDLDSTLLNGESINTVLGHIVSDKVTLEKLESIRAKSMRGELALKCSLQQRISLFNGMSLIQLQHICQNIPWTKGAKETIQQLKKRGYLTLCLSGGFRTVTRRTITELGMDAYCCNTLEHHHGKLTGKINGQLMQHQSKGNLLKEIQETLNIKPKNTLVVGDGANDLSMFEFASTRVAFCAQDTLKEQATHIIKRKDLREVLNILNF